MSTPHQAAKMAAESVGEYIRSMKEAMKEAKDAKRKPKDNEKFHC